MKKLIIATIVVIGFALAIVNWHPEKSSVMLQEKQTVENEQSKDFSLIRIIAISDNSKAIDAFGTRLKVGEWYLISNITRSVFPVNSRSYNYNELGRLMENGKKQIGKVVVANGDVMGLPVDAEILLLGEKKLVLNDLERYQVVFMK